MGCATRRDAEAFKAMPEVDSVLDSAHALELFLESHAPLQESDGLGRVPCFGDRTRALLKVQEGCSFPCAYCIVPAVRGPSRSVAPEQVVRGFAALLAAGFKEIVLTGINTGEYGKDRGWGGGLPALLERLLSLPGRYRIRLNSVEPRAVTPELMGLLKGEPRLCRHLQIPMQSGSDRVLADMRRNYRAGFYRDLVQRLATEVPEIGLGADVLVGFPTETSEDFEATLALLAGSPLAFIHAFSYSSRPGTQAGRLPMLPPRVVAERAGRVRALGKEKKEAFLRSFAGVEMEALTLVSEGGRGRALTGNFLDATIDEAVAPNRFVRLKILDTSGGKVGGTVVTRPE
jgi:threonylcarbamoyladenosine tRNA methylthiotransferase MtaB